MLAAGGTRLLQLFLLFVLIQLSSGTAQNTLVTGFALLSSFAIFTDSGGSNYLLQLDEGRLGRRVFARAMGLHVLLAVAGGAAASAITLNARGASHDAAVVTVLLALAVAQTAESTMRTARAPSLHGGRDVAYALPDLVLIGLKGPLVLVALVTGVLPVLAFVAIPSLVLGTVTYLINRRPLRRDVPVQRKLTLTILEYGVSGSLSSFYSQAPLVLGTAVLGVSMMAPLALAFRIVQPLEILPATVSQQLIPRLRRRRFAPVRVWAWFAMTGLVIAAVLALLAVGFSDAVPASFDLVVFLVILTSVPVKFGNYALVATAIGHGLVRSRLVAAAVVGVMTLAAVAAALVWAPSTALPAVTVASELFLLVTLSGLLHRRTETAKVIA
ncbi:polysaccharide transporter [Curtobacterium oceanosedimentum]|uniref:polysaccharide transporter n=1 Tax=Curtobacterium oceanosedimentum TaxID=465820 RepID=UPI001F231430|nr:polysaccharide transporter [Curtobacterium oceanosedimentum]